MIIENGVKFMRGVEDLKVEIHHAGDENICYTVSNTPVCQFDQHSRARIGASFYGYEVSESPQYVLYTNLYDNLKKADKFKSISETMSRLENIVDSKEIYESGNNFSEEEKTLMSRNCSYTVEQTWGSLFGQMSRRLKFCEEEFIVGLHWLLRDKLIRMGRDKAKEFKPGCDIIEKCDYSSADYLSNMFGCLFSSCGRWESGTEFATFNQSCTTPEMLEEQLDINIPRSSHEKLIKLEH